MIDPETLRLHALWLKGNPEGKRAHFVDRAFSGVDFKNLPICALTACTLAACTLYRCKLAACTLTDCALYRCKLDGCTLTACTLTGGKLDRCTLTRCEFPGVREDYWSILSAAPDEVPALRAALVEGRVDGSVYKGPCACLVGTLAKARGCAHDAIPGLEPDSERLAEQFFLSLRPGDTPEVSGVCRLAVAWLDEWLESQENRP